MSASAASTKTARARKPARPIYMTVQQLIRPDTGEMVGALVPSTQWDQAAMRKRRYKIGVQVRARLEKPRNVKLLRLGHALCRFIAERVPGFEDTDGHDALKRLQRECGAYCEAQELNLGSLGKVMVQVARSVAFDEMSDDEFADLLKQISRHIAEHYLSDMTPEDVQVAVEMMVQE